MFRICFGFCLVRLGLRRLSHNPAPRQVNLAEIPGLWSRHTMPIARAVDVVNWPN